MPRLVDVPAFFDSLLGVKGGVAFRMTDHVTFAPAIGVDPTWEAASSMACIVLRVSKTSCAEMHPA